MTAEVEDVIYDI